MNSRARASINVTNMRDMQSVRSAYEPDNEGGVIETPLICDPVRKITTRRRRTRFRTESVATYTMAIILAAAAAYLISELAEFTSELEQERIDDENDAGSSQLVRVIPEELVEPEKLPWDLSTKMTQWMANKQLAGNLFFTPSLGSDRKPSPYSAADIIHTLPHFDGGELILVMYSSATDEFIALLPGKRDEPPPKCAGGCVRIEGIMHMIMMSYRTQFPQIFRAGSGKDFMFLVSTALYPKLTKDCLDHPEICKRKQFAPILHFGSSFEDKTILPSLITMPPSLKLHLRCLAEWQQNKQVCSYILPRKVRKGTKDFMEGLVFANNIVNRTDVIEFDDLINQVVWRGHDAPYIPLLYPNLREPQSRDVEIKREEYGQGPRGVIQSLFDVYEDLRPRWKAVVITAEAEFEARAKLQNGGEQVLPWSNMKFSHIDIDSAFQTIDKNQQIYFEQWNALGVPARGEGMSLDRLAMFKYHIDIGGVSGTSWIGTLQKLAYRKHVVFSCVKLSDPHSSNIYYIHQLVCYSTSRQRRKIGTTSTSCHGSTTFQSEKTSATSTKCTSGPRRM